MTSKVFVPSKCPMVQCLLFIKHLIHLNTVLWNYILTPLYLNYFKIMLLIEYLSTMSFSIKKVTWGAPGWLSWLSVCFQLSSWSQDPGIQSCIRLPAHWGVCFSLCLCPRPPACALLFSLSNKIFKQKEKGEYFLFAFWGMYKVGVQLLAKIETGKGAKSAYGILQFPYLNSELWS